MFDYRTIGPEDAILGKYSFKNKDDDECVLLILKTKILFIRNIDFEQIYVIKRSAIDNIRIYTNGNSNENYKSISIHTLGYDKPDTLCISISPKTNKEIIDSLCEKLISII